MHILGMDIDSTIWDSTLFYHDALEDMGYPRLSHEDFISWDYHFDRFPREVVLEMFRRALDPSRLDERPLYPHVVEAIRTLREDVGVQIHFITHNAEPDALRTPLKKWLAGRFGGDVGLSTFHLKTPKLRKLNQLGAFGMVDDKPAFAVEVADAGLWSASKVHPYNKDVVLKDDRIFAFNDWREVPYAVALAIEGRAIQQLQTIGGRT
jgi:hypothetical protein